MHNNIKPSNVILFQNSIVKLADFCLEDIFKNNNIKSSSNECNWMNFPYTAP